jgi:hypothetical protein
MTTPLVVKFTKPSPTSLTMEVLHLDTNLIPRGDFDRVFWWVRGTSTQQDNRVCVANFYTKTDRDAALAAFVAAVDELNATLIPAPPPTDDNIVIVGTL